MAKCSHDGCPIDVLGRGLCHAHYLQSREYQDAHRVYGIEELRAAVAWANDHDETRWLPVNLRMAPTAEEILAAYREAQQGGEE